MIEPRQQAPGCFGAATVFSMDSTVCKACVAYKDCGDAAIETLEAIKTTVNVTDLLKRHQAARAKSANERVALRTPVPLESSPIAVAQPKPITAPIERKTVMQRVTFDVSPADEVVLARLGDNKKTKEQAIRLCKQNKMQEMREGLPQGINPFTTGGPAFMRVACDMLINGGFTKASLKARLMSELDWTDGTAGSHVAMISMLWYFGIMVTTADRFVLNPDLNVENKV